LHLTLHADYSLRVLLYLANTPERQVTTQEISQAYGISKHHLVRVVKSLGTGGFVTILPGRTGGIRLAKEPDQIRVSDVVKATEPGFRLVECFDGHSNTCPIVPVCLLQGALGGALQAFFEVLDRYTLADLIVPGGQAEFTSHLFPIEMISRE
jgi:Rrf2 family nitric oxide-sensitive transcriptional repressor